MNYKLWIGLDIDASWPKVWIFTRALQSWGGGYTPKLTERPSRWKIGDHCHLFCTSATPERWSLEYPFPLDETQSIHNTVSALFVHKENMSTQRMSNEMCYSPLHPKETRPVELLPVAWDNPLVVELRHRLWFGHGPPKYEALSYTWGAKETIKVITVIKSDIWFVAAAGNGGGFLGKFQRFRLDGKECKQYEFPITPNLEEALRSLRMSDVARTLWIDAISIDLMLIVLQ